MQRPPTAPDLLNELALPENAAFRAQFNEVRYRKNRSIYAPGHEDNLVFIIKTGRVQVYLAVDEKEFSLIILGPGDIYSTHTQAHVKALDNITLLTIPTTRLHAHMTAYPALTFTIITVLGRLLKQSFAIIDNLVFKDSHQRLIQFLLQEACHRGIKTPEGVHIDPNLTTTQIATIIGSSRQTASKILNSLFQRRLLEKKGSSD